MKAQDAIRSLIEGSDHWSQNRLGKSLGLSNQAMYERMSSKDLKVSFLADAVSKFHCTLAVLPPEAPLPKGTIIIDGRTSEN